jgi:hypothetical protein
MVDGPAPEDPAAAARAIWRRQSLEDLAGNPLGGIGTWVRTGAPPPAAELIAAGFTGGNAAHAADLRYLRKGFVNAWGCSIPCREAVDALVALSPLVELGAGTGYWAALLTAAGADIVATDLASAGPNAHGAELGRHFPVEALGAAAAVGAHPERNVFCSWPTLEATWPLEALRVLAPGRAFAMISEHAGGLAPPRRCSTTSRPASSRSPALRCRSSHRTEMNWPSGVCPRDGFWPRNATAGRRIFRPTARPKRHSLGELG